MHGVDVREEQDCRAVARGLIADDEVVGKPVPARHALDRNRQFRDIALHHVDHPIDRGLVAGRAFRLDPALNAGNHRSDVDRLML